MPVLKPTITVIKRNLAGEVTWQYSGQVFLPHAKLFAFGSSFQPAGYTLPGYNPANQ
jgi:hypothetical protein